MKSTIKHPLKRSILIGLVLFVLVLCVTLGIINYFSLKETLYDHNKDFILATLNHVAHHIDVDDLEECIATGTKSEKYNDLQEFLDCYRDNDDLEYIYIIIPPETGGSSDIRNVINGVRQKDHTHGSAELIELNQPCGSYYDAGAVKKFVEAYSSGELSFFEYDSEWGNEYTGLLPLLDSQGNKVAALCLDINIDEIQSQLYVQVAIRLAAAILVSTIFTVLFLWWLHVNVSRPIVKLEEAVSEFAAVSHLKKSPDELILEVPEIDSGNEVESLSNAVEKMGKDIRDYAQSLEDARKAQAEQSIALSESLGAAQEANRAKTAFLSNMSHEIRTPMNAIIGLDNIALSEDALSESTRDHLEKIGVSAHHLLRIINDILDMSRIESGRMTIKNEEFSFAKTLEQVNAIIKGQCCDKGLTYNCKVIGEVDEYYIGDDMKLRQIMINILGNAVKFTPEGGEVDFIVERTVHFDGKSTLRFIMKDTGIGMSKEFIPKIFDSFSQEEADSSIRYGSTGLGMSITKNLVELMNGSIAVDSEKGVGSTFTVSITLKDSDRSSMTGDGAEVHLGEISALLIDSDPAVCERVKLALEQEGISCEVARSGEKALKMIKLHNARREPYQLILVDRGTPESDGLETVRQIRSAADNDSSIILLTSCNCEDIADDARRAGVDGFVAKPVFISTIINEYRTAYNNRCGINDDKKAELNGRRVLVAEDVSINAEIILMLLKNRGIEADVAADGQDAVDRFASHPEGYYDAILMDMRMPKMNGLEATGLIRSMDRADSKTIPIIALTANAFDEDVQRSLQAGLNAHLSKPVEPESLYQTLESLIKS